MKKLALNKETLRAMETVEVAEVAGGKMAPKTWMTVCHTKGHCISKGCSQVICY